MNIESYDTQKGLIAWFARNPVAANLLMIFILLGGLYSAHNIPRTMQPKFELDLIQITVPYPGASPEEVELGIALKIEESLKDITEISETISNSRESLASVTVKVDQGYDVRSVMEDVKSAVEGISNMPEEAEKPVVKRIEFKEFALAINISGDLSEREMTSLVKQIRNEMLQEPGLKSVQISGPRNYEVAIEVPEANLLKYNLSLQDVANAIRAYSLNLPSGAIKTENGEIMLRTKGQAYRQYDFEPIPLINFPDGTHLTVGDIAVINDGFEEGSGRAEFDGKFSMGIMVYAADGQDLLAVANAARAYVDRKRAELPQGININYWAEADYYLKERLSMMLSNLGLGALLVFVVLAMFLDIKLAFWVMVGLPICFLGTFLVMNTQWVDLSVNMISIFGFILVLGIVVDDAIIIGESTGQFSERYGHNIDSVIAGAQRVATPATFGVLTTIMAFLPTIFGEGVFAPFPAAFGTVVIACLSFSLIESKLILPAHLAHVKPSTRGFYKVTDKLQRFNNGILQAFITDRYQPFLYKAIKHRYITATIFTATMILSVGLVAGGLIRFIPIPSVPNDFLKGAIEMVDGTTAEQMDDAYYHFQNAILEIDSEYKQSHNGQGLVKHIFAASHSNQYGDFLVELTKNSNRELDSRQIAKAWRDRVGEVPGSRIITVSDKTDSGGGMDIEFRLNSNSQQQLSEASDALAEQLKTYNGVYDVRNSVDASRDEIVLEPKPQASILGLQLSAIATQIRHAFYGVEAQRMQRENDEIKVMVRLPKDERKNVSDLENLYIQTPQRDDVPFSAIANANIEPGSSKLRRIDGHRAVTVGSAIDRAYAEPGKIVSDIEKNFLPELVKRFPAVKIGKDGMTKETDKVLKNLAIGMMAAILGIYALLAIPLKSYMQPLIIMGVIPFGIIGAIFGHMVMGITIDMNSIFGIIALSGVVVNDSLILVDFMNQAKTDDSNLADVVVQSGVQRFRAILLTSLTTFFGLVPMLMETSIQAQMLLPMAVSLAFGIIFSTVITLTLIPCLYIILDDIKFGKKKHSEPATEPVSA